MSEGFRSDMDIGFDLMRKMRDGITDANLPEYEFSMQQGPWTVLAAEDPTLVGRIFQWARKQPFGEGFVVADDQEETERFFGIQIIRKQHGS